MATELDFERREKLEGQARMLSIAHFIYGALTALFSLLPLIYVVIGAVFIIAPPPSNPNEPPPALFGAIFAAVGFFVFLLILAIAILNIVAGMNLSRRKGRTLIFVTSVINLLNQPFGLIVGILTLLYMIQADVKTLFELEAAGGDDLY